MQHVDERQHGPAIEKKYQEHDAQTPIVHISVGAEGRKQNKNCQHWDQVVEEIPDEGWNPVSNGTDSAYCLKVLGADRPFFDEKDDKTCRHKGHSKEYGNGDGESGTIGGEKYSANIVWSLLGERVVGYVYADGTVDFRVKQASHHVV